MRHQLDTLMFESSLDPGVVASGQNLRSPDFFHRAGCISLSAISLYRLFQLVVRLPVAVTTPLWARRDGAVEAER